MDDIGPSKCTVCSDTDSKSNADDWYWTLVENKLYYFCCYSCKEVFLTSPLPYEDNIQPIRMLYAPHRTYLDYWSKSFPGKQI